MLHPALVVLLLGLSVPAGGLTVTVNDVRSHGVLGDAFLSLDEAIGLANGSIATGQLSTAEQAQVSGSGATVEGISIDAAVTPTITLEGPLSDLVGQGQPIRIQGSAGGMGRPVLDGLGHPRILTLRTAKAEVDGLSLRGGQVGIDVRTANGGLIGDKAILSNLDLDGQAVSGIRLHAGGTNETTAAMIVHCELTNAPLGYDIDDQSNLGGLVCVSEYVTMDGVAMGIRINGSGMGGFSVTQHWRCSMDNGDTLVQLRRNPSSSQRQMVMVVFGEYHLNDDACDVQGSNAGDTIFHHHQAILQAGVGKACMKFGPRTSTFDIHGSENVLVGDVIVESGLFTQRIWEHNNVFRNGRLVIDNAGASPSFKWNRFESFPVDVLAGGRTPVPFLECEFHNSALTGYSTLGPIQLTGCYRTGSTMAGSVQESNPIPAPWYGETSVFPKDPLIGGTLSLESTLPQGMAGVWWVTHSIARPNLFDEPFRTYGDVSHRIVLPAVVVFRTRIDVPVPNDPALVALEFFVQPISFPYQGQTYTPPFHVMRGDLVRPRL